MSHRQLTSSWLRFGVGIGTALPFLLVAVAAAGMLGPTKAFAGTLALTGSNTYSGGTTLIGGVLAVGSAGRCSTRSAARSHPPSAATSRPRSRGRT